MISEETKQKWDDRIEILLERDHMLKDRELEFVESIQLQRSHDKELSSPQIAWLYAIFEKVGSW